MISEQRLRAVMDSTVSTVSKYQATVDGGRVISDGRIAVLSDLEIATKPGELAPLAKLWTAAEASASAEVGGVYCVCGRRLRRIGREVVNEAYYRLFPAEAQWQCAEGKDRAPLVVTLNGKRIGVVMPVMLDGLGNPTPCEAEPTDAEVYEQFACEANGYAFQAPEFAVEQDKKELEELEAERSQRESQLDDLQGEIDEIDKEIAALRKRIEVPA